MKSGEGKKPIVDAFVLAGKLLTSFSDVAKALRGLSFLEVAQDKDGVSAVYVESRDIEKNPYVFSILRITEDSLSLQYTVPPQIAPRKRRIDMIKYVLNILTLLEGKFKVDEKSLFQLIELSIKELSELSNVKTSTLYIEYDTMKKKLQDMERLVARLKEENSALKNELYELRSKYDELALKIKKYEAISDEALKEKIYEWLAEHNGKINIVEFSKFHNVPENRVEALLNSLVMEGYIEPVQ